MTDEELDRELAKARRIAELEGSLKSPEESATSKVVETGKNVLGFAAETAKNAGKGMLNAADSALQGHPFIGPILNALGLATSGKTPKQAIAGLPVEDMGMWGKAAQGAGGGLLGAPSAITMPVAALAGATGALGGEAGGNFAEKSGWPRAVGEIPGSLLAGGATGFSLGPKQTVGQADIRRALDGASDKTWLEAAGKVNDFNAVGSKTATLGEAFPKNSAIQDLTHAARGGNLQNAIKQRTVGRDEDLQGLGNEFLNRIGPKVQGNAVAERVAQAANAIELNLAKLKNEGFRNRLGDEVIRPDLVKKLEDALEAAAQAEVRGGPKGAYREIAAKLRNPDTGELITRTSELSKVLYGIQTELKTGAVLGRGGNSIQANDMAIPLADAKKGLGELSPRFEAASADARAFNKGSPQPGPRGEFAESPLKALADRNPNLIDPTPVSRLNKLFAGTDGDEVSKLAASLERDPGLRPGQGVGPLEMARALMQEKLKGAPTNPGASVRGNAGSSQEEQIAALLSAGGQNPARTMLPLEVADDLQGMSGAAGMKEMPRMSPIQGLLRPFRTADMAITGQGLKGIEKEIADLLANPTIPALNRLREIAMFDPNVRRQLSIIAPLLGQMGASN